MSITRSYADLEYRENTIESLRRAARLDPPNATFHLALGVQLDLAGEDPEPEYRTAAALDPLLAEPWLRLGLLAESRGDAAAAERLLLHAAAVNHQLLPRSTLMNFYVRRDRPAAFWHWARLAFDRAYGDSSPLFDLCWRMASYPAEVYAKAIPRAHDVLRSYLEYLVSRSLLPAAAEPARDFLAQATPDDRGLILDYCDRLIDISPAEALWVWNEASRRGLLPYPPLHPEHLAAIVNPRFTADPLQKAFDWKLASVQQISTARLPSGGMEFSFSGRQPENVEMMAQTFPVLSGKRYGLTVQYRTEDIANPTGLLLIAADRKAGTQLGSVPLAPSDNGRQAFAFDSPSSGLVTLRLWYRRPLGSVRTEGTLTVQSVHLEAAP